MSLTHLFRTALCEIMNLDAKIYSFEVEDFHTCYIISNEKMFWTDISKFIR